MKVKIRHIDSTRRVMFTECKFSEFHALINFINQSGGIYDHESEQHEPILDWQLCNDDNECYAEIIVGEE